MVIVDGKAVRTIHSWRNIEPVLVEVISEIS
jgi:hypothetical protein